MPTVTPNLGLYKPLINNATDENLWGGYLNDDMDIIDAYCFNLSTQIAALGAVPTGGLVDYAGSSAPVGWLLCYGQAVSRVTYAALFTAIGTTYGSGDGSTTFNLPDCRGRVGAGKDDMGGVGANRLTNQPGGVNGDILGGAGGLETHTLTVAQLAAHNHPPISGTYLASGGGAAQTPLAGSGATTFSTTSDTGGGQAHNNVQPTIIFNKIIKT